MDDDDDDKGDDDNVAVDVGLQTDRVVAGFELCWQPAMQQ